MAWLVNASFGHSRKIKASLCTRRMTFLLEAHLIFLQETMGRKENLSRFFDQLIEGHHHNGSFQIRLVIKKRNRGLQQRDAGAVPGIS